MHAKNRAAERYGIVLDHETHRILRDTVTGQRPHPGTNTMGGQKVGKHRRLYRVNFYGLVIRVIWDKLNKTIVTLLPQDEEDLLVQAKLAQGIAVTKAEHYNQKHRKRVEQWLEKWNAERIQSDGIVAARPDKKTPEVHTGNHGGWIVDNNADDGYTILVSEVKEG